MLKNYYDILEVNRNASRDDIKASRNRLVRRFSKLDGKGHFSNDNTKIIQEINEAYATLSDEKTRADYDAELETVRPLQQEQKSSNGKDKTPNGDYELFKSYIFQNHAFPKRKENADFAFNVFEKSATNIIAKAVKTLPKEFYGGEGVYVKQTSLKNESYEDDTSQGLSSFLETFYSVDGIYEILKPGPCGKTDVTMGHLKIHYEPTSSISNYNVLFVFVKTPLNFLNTGGLLSFKKPKFQQRYSSDAFFGTSPNEAELLETLEKTLQRAFKEASEDLQRVKSSQEPTVHKINALPKFLRDRLVRHPQNF
ncbi:MAG: DnaJ domain-containing protein [Alphaproteobacteria bacterium]|nr:DnaJ domain-containing protein [Alphaproteobacteria bacterium]